MDAGTLCARYRELYLPAVCDALYALGLPEQVLPTSLRPLFPEQRVVGVAFTVRGEAIEPRIGWDDGIERIRSYLEVYEQLEPDSMLVHVNGSKPRRPFRRADGELGEAARVRRLHPRRQPPRHRGPPGHRLPGLLP